MQRMKELFNRYDSALNHKAGIINNIESYYYYVTISTKKRNRFCGIVVNPSYVYHTERRFNQAAYDQTLAVACARIHEIGTEIETALSNLRNSLQFVTEELASYYANYRIASSNNNQLDYIIEQSRQQLHELVKNNSGFQQDLTSTSEQSHYYAVETKQLQNRVHENKSNSIYLRQECRVKSEASLQVLKSADLQQRAFFLSELWLNKNNKENENAVQVIRSLGFDANALAYYAILKNNEELFDLALLYKADCSSYMVEGKTLLQKLIHSNNSKLVQKVLAQCTDVSTTVLNAAGTDMLTINKLLENNTELTKQKFFGYTLLQIAIDAKNQPLVERILDIDSSSATILTNNGESALKIAVRSGNDDIVKLIASQVTLETEVDQLGSQVSHEIKAKILKQRDIETVIKLFKGETGLLAQYIAEQSSSDETNLLEFVPNFNNDSILEELDSNFASMSVHTPYHLPPCISVLTKED